jgi:hypothetical protein
VLRFWQEARADTAAEKLKAIIQVTATAIRDGIAKEMPLRDLVPGDIIQLSAGDMIPGDVRVRSSKDLFVAPRQPHSLQPARHRLTKGGSKGPSRISNDLYPGSHVARRTDLQPMALCPDLPVRHSVRAKRTRFRGAETRSTPLPTSDRFSRFGTVSIRIYSQALLAPFMVELFAAGG